MEEAVSFFDQFAFSPGSAMAELARKRILPPGTTPAQ